MALTVSALSFASPLTLRSTTLEAAFQESFPVVGSQTVTTALFPGGSFDSNPLLIDPLTFLEIHSQAQVFNSLSGVAAFRTAAQSYGQASSLG